MSQKETPEIKPGAQMEGGAKGRVPLPALRQAMAVAGLSLGCTLDGMVIAYSSPAIPSLLEDGDIEANYHHASWIGTQSFIKANIPTTLFVNTDIYPEPRQYILPFMFILFVI